MAELKSMKNGIRRRANPTTKTASNPKRHRTKQRNGTTKAGALSFAKKNGLKLVKRTASNPKQRKQTTRRRNGIATVRTRQNGFFGKTKSDVKNVAALTGGAVATNLAGNTIASMLQPYFASFGLGNYASILTQLLVAVFGVPYIAQALAGKDAAAMARLGGLLSVALDLLATFFPQFSTLNPFTSSPIVISGSGQIAVTPEAAAAIAKAASEDTAAKVGGFMNQLAMNSGSGFVDGNYLPMKRGGLVQ